MSVLRVLRAHRGIGKTVRGAALVASDGFSARYDLDRQRGVFSRPEHALYGQSYVGRVLVLSIAKGGVASAWMLREMLSGDRAPVALLLNSANPVIAQGAAFAELTLMDRFETDVTTALRTGELLEVDPAAGEVRVLDPGTPG